jgi:tetratricopeptide (TPR) repeat protein
MLKNAISTDPDFHNAKTQLVSNYFRQMRTGLRTPEDTTTEMIALLEQVLAFRPDDVRAKAWILVARVIQENLAGEIVSASEFTNELRTLVAEAPNEVEPKRLLLQLLGSSGETEEAMALMQDLLVLDPLNSWLLVEISQAYFVIEDWDSARAAVARSLELEPDQPAPYEMLAFIDLATGNAVGHVSNHLRAMEADPQDHGYAARLAQFLYGLGLQQQGDRFRDRSIAIAPTSSHARNTELTRAVRAGDQGMSLALARQMIEDDVDQHSTAWGNAAFVLFEMSEKQGTSEDALAFVETQFPGFTDYSQPVPYKGIELRINAFIAYFHTESFDQLQQRLAHLDYFVKEFLPDEGGPVLRMGALALRGETEAAIDVALTEIFSKPAVYYLDNDRSFSLHYIADVAADPRIQEAIERWRKDKAEAAEDVATYLAGPDSF